MTFEIWINVNFESWLLFTLWALFFLMVFIKSWLSFVNDNSWAVINWPCGVPGGFFGSKEESGIDFNFFFNVSWKVLILNFADSTGGEIPDFLFSDGRWLDFILGWLLSWSLCWIEEVVIIRLTGWVRGLVEFAHLTGFEPYEAFINN